MKTLRRSVLSVPAHLSVSAALCACGGTDGRTGLDQPLRVHAAQFVEGDLPVERESSSKGAPAPTVTAVTSEVAALRERLANVGFFGLASRNARAIGVRFADVGDGYYLFPAGAVDAQDPSVLGWSFVADLMETLPPGRHELLTVAFDEEGHPGPPATTSLCVRSLRPDNGNACFPTLAPPPLVISVTWDSPVDLDLAVVTPSGVTISAKQASSVRAGELTRDGEGALQYDGNADCRMDGRQREDIVFNERPAAGRYSVYVNLSRHCGQSSVTYEVARHVREQLEGATFTTTSRAVGAGSLMATQANGGARIGTFVGELKVE